MLRRRVTVGIALVFTLALGHVGRAQVSGTALIVGTVLDPSGAAVAGANVELRDANTNILRTTDTNSAGQYNLDNVLPGNYVITVKKEGFRPAVLSGAKIDVARSYTFNFSLVLGVSAQVVKVDATNQEQLQTNDSTVGDVLQHESLLRLPNINRDASTYLFLQPTANPAPNTSANSSLTVSNSGQIAGARSDQNNMMLDGVDVTDRAEAAAFYGALGEVQSIQPAIPTPAESVEEFRVGVTNPTAEYSVSAGGQVTMVTRRGTNDFHGSVYDYFQNDSLNANTWENDLLGNRKPKLNDNRFGASLGGPVSKDNTFFFVNYEGRRFPHSQTITQLVPTSTLRAGILQFRDATGVVRQYNVASFDPRGLGSNPVISSVWSLLPPGNDVSQGDGLNYIGFTAPVSAPLNSNFGVIRLDHNLNKQWYFTSTFHYAQSQDLNASQLDTAGLVTGDKPGVPAALSNEPTQQRLATAGLAGMIRPSLTSNFRFGWFRYYVAAQRVSPFPQVPSTNVALLVAGGAPGQPGQPGVRLLDQPVDVDPQRASSTTIQSNGWEFLESLAWVKGAHILSFGGSLYRFTDYGAANSASSLALVAPVAQIDSLSNTPVPAGQRPVTCNGAAVTTNCLLPTDVSTWNRLYYASLGIIDNVSYVSARDGNFNPLPPGSPVVSTFTNYLPQFYFADAWRLKPSLTLNLGLTYEWQTPPVEDKNRQDVLINQGTGQVISASSLFAAREASALQGNIYNPTLAFQTVTGLNRRTVTNTDWKNFGPRVALAWNPHFSGGMLGRMLGDHKTVLRGGYSLVYDRMNGTNAQIESSLSAFYQTLNVSGPVNASGEPFRIGVDGPAPLPAVPVENLPYAPSVPFGTLFAVSENPTNTIGRAHLLDFTIQRKLASKLLLEVGYVGRLGRNLRQDTTLNAAPYFMVDKQSGQTFAQAFDAVAQQLRTGVPVTAVTSQPWFQNYIPSVSGGCGGGTANASQCLALMDSSDFVSGNVSSLWENNMDFLRLSNGQTPGLNLQIAEPIVRAGGTKSNYNALFVSFHGQKSYGFTFDVNYTYSKSLDFDGDVQNNGLGLSSPFNPNLDYGPSQFDRTHVLNAHWYEELPFGKGHRFSTGNVADKLTGGWYTAGIFTANSGLPLCPTYGTGAFGGGIIIGPVNCGVPLTSSNPGNSIHNLPSGRNLFADPAAVLANYRPILISQDGRNPRGTLRGLPAWQVDLSVGKMTNVTERIRLVFSADLINALNHPLFSDPSLQMTSPGTFGDIPVTQRNNPRQVQLGLRVEF